VSLCCSNFRGQMLSRMTVSLAVMSLNLCQTAEKEEVGITRKSPHWLACLNAVYRCARERRLALPHRYHDAITTNEIAMIVLRSSLCVAEATMNRDLCLRSSSEEVVLWTVRGRVMPCKPVVLKMREEKLGPARSNGIVCPALSRRCLMPAKTTPHDR
jgi:hypothetical protein